MIVAVVIGRDDALDRCGEAFGSEADIQLGLELARIAFAEAVLVAGAGADGEVAGRQLREDPFCDRSPTSAPVRDRKRRLRRDPGPGHDLRQSRQRFGLGAEDEAGEHDLAVQIGPVAGRVMEAEGFAALAQRLQPGGEMRLGVLCQRGGKRIGCGLDARGGYPEEADDIMRGLVELGCAPESGWLAVWAQQGDLAAGAASRPLRGIDGEPDPLRCRVTAQGLDEVRPEQDVGIADINILA